MNALNEIQRGVRETVGTTAAVALMATLGVTLDAATLIRACRDRNIAMRMVGDVLRFDPDQLETLAGWLMYERRLASQGDE